MPTHHHPPAPRNPFHTHPPREGVGSTNATSDHPTVTQPVVPQFLEQPARPRRTLGTKTGPPTTPRAPPQGQSPRVRGWVLLRKEVIQPHLPVRLPCYDFVPIASPTFDHSPPHGLGHGLRVLPTFVT